MGACGASQAPDTASDTMTGSGTVPHLGEASQGAISVSGASVQQSGTQLAVTATIRNAGASADELDSVMSQVSNVLTLSPPVTLPPHGSVVLGEGKTRVVLTQNGRLEPGGTVALTLNFRNAGAVEVFSSFS